MVKKDFFMKNYKKSKNHGHSQFFSIYKKKSLTIIVKYLRAPLLRVKGFFEFPATMGYAPVEVYFTWNK